MRTTTQQQHADENKSYSGSYLLHFSSAPSTHPTTYRLSTSHISFFPEARAFSITFLRRKEKRELQETSPALTVLQPRRQPLDFNK
jgi:hypothetical protein